MARLPFSLDGLGPRAVAWRRHFCDRRGAEHFSGAKSPNPSDCLWSRVPLSGPCLFTETSEVGTRTRLSPEAGRVPQKGVATGQGSSRREGGQPRGRRATGDQANSPSPSLGPPPSACTRRAPRGAQDRVGARHCSYSQHLPLDLCSLFSRVGPTCFWPHVTPLSQPRRALDGTTPALGSAQPQAQRTWSRCWDLPAGATDECPGLLLAGPRTLSPEVRRPHHKQGGPGTRGDGPHHTTGRAPDPSPTPSAGHFSHLPNHCPGGR